MWLLAALACAFVVGAAAAWAAEKREWNGGVDPASGEPWRYFDTDSQGGRGYEAGGRHIWISWPGIDGKKRL